MIFKTFLIFTFTTFTFIYSGCSVKDVSQKKPVVITDPVIVGSPSTTPTLVKNEPLYRIFYGTNRNPNNLDDFAKGYSNKRSKKLYTGECYVLVPDHEKRKIGEIKGSLKDKLLHFDMSYGDIQLRQIVGYKNQDQLWLTLQSIFASTNKKEALIFIHGYNNSFEDAAIRTAQLGYDLGVNGVTAFFSWPSAANPILYSSDEATIQASEKYIKEFITGFVKKSGAEKVHIIAHSMGNRGLLRAMNDIQKESPDVRFGQIILAAPDVDADLFKDIASAYTKLSDRTTLYVSPKDKAVWLSKVKHDYPRAGVVTPVSVVDNIDTIRVDFNFDLLALGHTYFAEEKILLEDIDGLLKKSNAPINRKMLIPGFNEEYKKYWLLNLEK